MRGAAPYPWWQWVIVGIFWGGTMFLTFNVLTLFRFVALNAVAWSIGGASFALLTRHRIARRERERRVKRR